MGVPTLIQEQNSYAGLTNKLLARGARRICVAYDGMGTLLPGREDRAHGQPAARELLDGAALPAPRR